MVHLPHLERPCQENVSETSLDNCFLVEGQLQPRIYHFQFEEVLSVEGDFLLVEPLERDQVGLVEGHLGVHLLFVRLEMLVPQGQHAPHALHAQAELFNEEKNGAMAWNSRTNASSLNKLSARRQRLQCLRVLVIAF